jgi:putative ABC transport system permease protein
MRSDVAVWMVEPVDDAARHDLARLPGVLAVESTRFVPVAFVHGGIESAA